MQSSLDPEVPWRWRDTRLCWHSLHGGPAKTFWTHEQTALMLRCPELGGLSDQPGDLCKSSLPSRRPPRGRPRHHGARSPGGSPSQGPGQGQAVHLREASPAPAPQGPSPGPSSFAALSSWLRFWPGTRTAPAALCSASSQRCHVSGLARGPSGTGSPAGCGLSPAGTRALPYTPRCQQSQGPLPLSF